MNERRNGKQSRELGRGKNARILGFPNGMDGERRYGIGRDDVGVVQDGESGGTSEVGTRWNDNGTSGHGSPCIHKPTSI